MDTIVVTDTAPNTNQGNYEDVGTPSTGELPTGKLDMGDTEGLSKDVTVY